MSNDAEDKAVEGGSNEAVAMDVEDEETTPPDTRESVTLYETHPTNAPGFLYTTFLCDMGSMQK